jgi:gamma-glutamylcyclotransferase (GGCT)/AIG2-like uncharacterized protein YtfP
MLTEAKQLLNSFTERNWNAPFPMGVFGTLRKDQWNTHRMEAGKYTLHCKAFMPHFIAKGLGIYFEKNASAPFEIFYYPQAEWDKMIPGVDALESFSPKREKGEFGYYRTLAWLHVLPDNFDHKLFKTKNLDSYRNLEIPLEEWSQYERVPAWVYSSKSENAKALQSDVVIWG